MFEYLDFYDVYNGFFHLNKRFQHLLLHSTLPIKMNTPTVSKSNFERYYEDIIIPNKHRINIYFVYLSHLLLISYYHHVVLFQISFVLKH
jgi:hypothetical protein